MADYLKNRLDRLGRRLDALDGVQFDYQRGPLWVRNLAGRCIGSDVQEEFEGWASIAADQFTYVADRAAIAASFGDPQPGDLIHDRTNNRVCRVQTPGTGGKFCWLPVTERKTRIRIFTVEHKPT